VGGRLGEHAGRKNGKPGGLGGQCKMSVINRVHTIIVRSRCVEGWGSLRGENLYSLQAMEASAKGY
jgi:hypothetical protein